MVEQIYNHPGRHTFNHRFPQYQLSIDLNDCAIVLIWLYIHNMQLDPVILSDRRKKLDERDCHKHTFYEFHMMLRGEQIYTVEGEPPYRIRAGEALLLPPQVVHGNARHSEGMSKVAFAFDIKDRETNVPSLLKRSLPQRARVCTNNDRIVQCILEITEETLAQQPLSMEITQTLIYRMVLEIARQTGATKPVVRSSERLLDERVKEIEEFIDNHLSDSITIQDVADSIHLSTRQINRLFQQEFSMNCSELIAQKRTEEAKRLLLFTDMCIKDIAVAVGFANAFSFGKFFKNREGMSPGLFRRSRFK